MVVVSEDVGLAEQGGRPTLSLYPGAVSPRQVRSGIVWPGLRLELTFLI